jgi:simple sugar transport system permease protein
MIRITKRGELPKNLEWAIRTAAVLLSILFAGVVIAILGVDPVKVFTQIINGAVGSQMRLTQTILKSIPLIITSMGILVAFKMKFWNIGGEGQIMMGAMGASFIALRLSPELPSAVMFFVMMAAAMACGGMWAFIPAFFKARFGTNEVIFTLMMNYIAIKWVTYLQFDIWKDPNSLGFPQVAPFPANAVLPKVLGIHAGWIIAILTVILIYIFINHTKVGYEVTVLGESRETARYAGMNIKYIMVTAMMISGGLCGLAGMVQASAIEKTLTYSLSAGYGFTAIITTWLGRLSAPAIAIVCFVFAMLLQGGTYLQIALSVPAAVAEMIQGIILFFVLGSEFFIQYKISFSAKAKKEVA